MLPEMIVVLLCAAAFMILLWDILLRSRMTRIEKKLKALEKKKRETG